MPPKHAHRSRSVSSVTNASRRAKAATRSHQLGGRGTCKAYKSYPCKVLQKSLKCNAERRKESTQCRIRRNKQIGGSPDVHSSKSFNEMEKSGAEHNALIFEKVKRAMSAVKCEQCEQHEAQQTTLETRTRKLKKDINAEHVAGRYGITLELLKKYNPELEIETTQMVNKGTRLKIPQLPKPENEKIFTQLANKQLITEPQKEMLVQFDRKSPRFFSRR